MKGVVADTHSVLWYLFDNPALSQLALDTMRVMTIVGDPIYVPSVCLVEATYLAEKGRIAIEALERLTTALRSLKSGFQLAALDLGVALQLRRVPRDAVPDMPDRIIAATALALDLPLVTRDGKIRGSGIQTIW
jgi:PIN domain nuclease of toxin-antitoxin system